MLAQIDTKKWGIVEFETFQGFFLMSSELDYLKSSGPNCNGGIFNNELISKEKHTYENNIIPVHES